jgi:hypothetical protein
MSTLTKWMPTLTKLDVNIDINDGRVNVSTQPPPPQIHSMKKPCVREWLSVLTTKELLECACTLGRQKKKRDFFKLYFY